jgi:DNA polymerase I
MKSKSKSSLYLVDGSSYIFRAFHATARQRLSNARGLPTGAIYVFTSMLQKLIREEKPDYLAVVWDPPVKTFRHKMYPEYKANRAETPPDLVPQFAYIRSLVQAFGIPALEQEGYEADDVIGTLSKKAEEEGFEVVLVSGDKDLTQLLGPHVTMLDTLKNKVTDVAGVKERFGVTPDHVIDVLALMGDSSDNVPGVPKVGEKTAIKLIAQYGDLNNVLAHAGEIKGAVGESLRANERLARLSKELVTIKTKVPVPFNLESLKPKSPDRAKLVELFKELDFGKLLAEYSVESKAIPPDQYRLITTEAELTSLIQELRAAGRFALDTETTSKDQMRAELVGLSFCAEPHRAVYLPVAHTGEGAQNQIARERALEILRPLLEDPAVKKIGQNAKYDLIVLARAGVQVQGLDFDTMVASYLLNPRRRSHGLDALALEFLGHKMISYEEVTDGGKKKFSEVPVEQALRYSGEDADVTLMLHDLFLPLLKEGEFEELFREIEMPLIGVLIRIEMNGVKVDTKLLAQLSAELLAREEKEREEIFRLAGQEFNIDSPKQLSEILFDKLQLPRLKKTKTGYSTNVDVLTKLAAQHDLPRHVLDYRTLVKLQNTYTDALPLLVLPETGRIHTSLNQTVASTGRLSSSEPNLQNIPVRTAVGKRIREAFVAEPGRRLLSADYSQVELRILAHITEDPTLLQAFERDEDIHRRTAAEVFGVIPEMVTEEMRRQAKVINFGIAYGMSGYGLSEELGISQKEALQYIDEYFRRYPGVYRYIQETIALARKQGYVTTLMNRRCYLPEIKSDNFNVRQFAEREAINAPIQGSAADIIKKAMVEIDRELIQRQMKSTMILQVHDELVFEAPQSEEKELEKLVVSKMESVVNLKVRLKVDAGWGKNWAEAH